jgi:hypothetical protein
MTSRTTHCRLPSGGKQWNGWKLVEGRSNRRYTDEAADVADAVSAAGYDPYERKVLGITAMTSLLGKKRFEEVLGGYIEKPQGKPTLVPESDKRPAIQSPLRLMISRRLLNEADTVNTRL